MRAIGAIDETPLVVKTADLARFVQRHLESGPNGRPTYDKMVERIKTAKKTGQIVHGVSYEVLKRIVKVEAPVTADSCADEILVANGGTDLLGKDIPLYRNPALPDWKYERIFRKRLEVDWNEEEDLEFIRSFPKIA